ncbi:tryptophan synthase beta subunit-like PLP-dependent enzyme [Xylariaceae sp. FL0255]|nr:tryptophan synthase beta subunit-like PLP-dependent enzyme [Xylariaceae sp. FL0255]
MADPSTSLSLTRASVIEAHKLIKAHVHRTPTLTNATLNRLASTPRTYKGDGTEGRKKAASPKIRLYFKCENLQRIGAFKIRGAFHAIERLSRDEEWVKAGGRERGVVTHSSGNHAQALALAAREYGIPAHIVMPKISAAPKIAATKGYGAHVIFSGSTSVEREAVVEEVIKETGARLVPPYDHPDIMLGQGTLGLELMEDAGGLIAAFTENDGEGNKGDGEVGSGSEAKFNFTAPTTRPSSSIPSHKRPGSGGTGKPALDAILAPCGGGGMLSGVALSAEGTGTRIFGCEPSFQGADDAKRGYESGSRIPAVSSLTVADGLRTPVGIYPWGIIYERKLVKGFYSVTDEQIIAAMKLMFERFKMVVEPSGAVSLAVALFNEEFRSVVEKEGGEDGWDVGLVVSGGNVSLEALGELFKVKEGGEDLGL